MIGGWADVFIGPQLETWSQLATQEESTLVIGPWSHLGTVAADVKQEGVGDELGLSPTYFQWARVIDWFDHHLKGEPLKYLKGHVLTYPVNGEGWVVRDSWPPPTTDRVFGLARGEDPVRCTGALGEGG